MNYANLFFQNKWQPCNINNASCQRYKVEVKRYIGTTSALGLDIGIGKLYNKLSAKL